MLMSRTFLFFLPAITFFTSLHLQLYPVHFLPEQLLYHSQTTHSSALNSLFNTIVENARSLCFKYPRMLIIDSKIALAFYIFILHIYPYLFLYYSYIFWLFFIFIDLCNGLIIIQTNNSFVNWIKCLCVYNPWVGDRIINLFYSQKIVASQEKLYFIDSYFDILYKNLSLIS